jgi:hypothetical protein
MELDNINLTKVSQAQKVKNHMFSYAEYRSETNTAILLDMGHILRGECAWEKYGKGMKPKT